MAINLDVTLSHKIMFPLIAAVLVVLIGSSICSSVETALFSVSTLKVRQIAQSNNASAIALLAIREKMNRPITTLVILNNLFNIIGSIAIAGIADVVLGDALLGAFSVLLTFLIIVFGEIIPKTFGERNAMRLGLFAALPVTALTFVFTPLVWIMEQVTAPFTKGVRQPTTNEAEIQFMAKIGHQEGEIQADEAEMIQRIFRLNDLTAVDLMTPRPTLTYLPGALTLDQARNDIIASQHTRIVITGETIDQVIGIALKAELLAAIVEGHSQWQIASLVRAARFVPELARVDKLLKTFQDSREHLAVVVDEYGGTSGVITLEDVLEVLTGEIVDETDQSVDLQEIARRRRRNMFQQ